eukprot:14795317-Ditylum_brightwellii.AAC.1
MNIFDEQQHTVEDSAVSERPFIKQIDSIALCPCTLITMEGNVTFSVVIEKHAISNDSLNAWHSTSSDRPAGIFFPSTLDTSHLDLLLNSLLEDGGHTNANILLHTQESIEQLALSQINGSQIVQMSFSNKNLELGMALPLSPTNVPLGSFTPSTTPQNQPSAYMSSQIDVTPYINGSGPIQEVIENASKTSVTSETKLEFSPSYSPSKHVLISNMPSIQHS